MLDAWRELIPDIPDSFDWTVWLFLFIVLGVGIYKWLESRKEAEDRPDSIERVLRAGVDGPEIALIYYKYAFSEAWATEHAKTLSWIYGRSVPRLKEAYGTYHRPVSEAEPISTIIVTNALDPRYDGQIDMFGNVVLRPFQDHHDGGAWSWELRNSVRWFNYGIPTSGSFEFQHFPGDNEAKDIVDRFRKRP